MRPSNPRFLLLALLVGCGSAPPPSPPPPASTANAPVAPPIAPRADEATPLLELPSDVHAVREQIELTVDPTATTVHGTADLELKLDRGRDVIWLHGLGLGVTRIEAHSGATAPLVGRWEDAHPSGVAKVTFPSAIGAGAVTLHVAWDAPFAPGGKGLYLVKQAGRSYAATQFEAIFARRAFPCLDQPSAKIPFELTLVIAKDDQAIANTKEISRESLPGDRVRVRFAPTMPIPSYLVAFAVGPYDVIAAPDLPPNALRTTPLSIRGVAAKGRGPELAYALAHAGELLGKLEEYFGIAYPYDKLDLLAIPEQRGAMENVGAITFSEDLLLINPKTAPKWQLRGYGAVVAHELAHQWFGDIVTMRWWDDLWLNEAFATWMAAKIADRWDPQTRSGIEQLVGVQGAMGSDALTSARSVRQAIATNDDIENAFDGITYQKGAGVIRMFEKWVGEDAFQRGVHTYLNAHRFGSASSDEFLSAISDAAGKDVRAPFRTFLDQPGVPYVEVAAVCDGKPHLHVKQSRYLPLGSKGDAHLTWQFPFCARYAVGSSLKETCALVDAAEADVPLEGCPDWVIPNARAAGYYRFSLAADDLARLRKSGLKNLDLYERIAFANSLRAAFNRGSLPFGDIVTAAGALADDPHHEVAAEAMNFVTQSRDWLYADPARPQIEAHARKLFGGVGRAVGLDAKKGEDVDRASLRPDVLGFLADTAQDPAVRAELAKRGRAYIDGDGSLHPERVAPDITGLALRVWSESGDARTFDTLRTALGKTEQAEVRDRLLGALGAMRAPELAAKARAMALDPSLRSNETLSTLWAQVWVPEMREAAWTWTKDNFEALFARMKVMPFGSLQLIELAGEFCDETRAEDVRTFFEPRVSKMDGGPRQLASVVERIHLCAVKRAKHDADAKRFFARK